MRSEGGRRPRWREAAFLATAAALGTGIWVLAAGGPNVLAVQFAWSVDRFTDLFGNDTVRATRIQRTHAGLRRDYFFIGTYIAALLLWAKTVHPTSAWPNPWAALAAIGAGVFDILEDLATSDALDALTAGRAPNSAKITVLATAKWVLLTATVTYLICQGVRARRARRRRSAD